MKKQDARSIRGMFLRRRHLNYNSTIDVRRIYTSGYGELRLKRRKEFATSVYFSISIRFPESVGNGLTCQFN